MRITPGNAVFQITTSLNTSTDKTFEIDLKDQEKSSNIKIFYVKFNFMKFPTNKILLNSQGTKQKRELDNIEFGFHRETIFCLFIFSQYKVII